MVLQAFDRHLPQASAHALWLQGIVNSDPQLAEYAEHLKYRYAQYQQTRDAIEGAEGSLANFAKVPGNSCNLIVPDVDTRGIGQGLQCCAASLATRNYIGIGMDCRVMMSLDWCKRTKQSCTGSGRLQQRLCIS
jgi:hypothetical protein